MPKNERTTPAAASLTLSEQATNSVNDILDKRLAELGLDRARQYGAGGQPLDDVIMNPNGEKVHIAQFMDHEYIAEDHHSIFADPPETYLVAPNPDCMYVWADKKDPKLFARIRSGGYRPVGTDELRDDTDLPVTTHTVPGITHKVEVPYKAEVPDGKGGTTVIEEVRLVEEPRRLVACYDVVLMEVQPSAVKRWYKWPAFQAMLRTKGNLPFQALKKRIEQESHGYATAEMTVKQVS